ncbi:amidohydrolase [Maribellus sp. YY47]|uniref:amidohydrolase n=1 Tax=Maribellus sp. YY47 TaxID=2929486 RepID=UPI002001700B|nr:amidohydrolase [Maribellus sp. YY47]MCK3686067.1 amidohydrolase [Maribellus sp. YY47]
MENLKITIIQPDIIWENITANLEKYSRLIGDVIQPDLIVLPEMFTTGFSMNPEKHKEPMNGPTISWMKNIAKEKDASVVGSLIVEENGLIYNRAVWVFPDGEVKSYDKRHLYTMGKEHLYYEAGRSKTIIEYKGWKFCPLICYDLRFPVWARNAEDYDVLIYMANWPSPRHHVWKNLLVARAIENQCYCVGINRSGSDGAGLSYKGNSACVSPKGFADFMPEEESVQTFEISYSDLHKFRKSFPLLDDKDSFIIEI